MLGLDKQKHVARRSAIMKRRGLRRRNDGMDERDVPLLFNLAHAEGPDQMGD